MKILFWYEFFLLLEYWKGKVVSYKIVFKIFFVSDILFYWLNENILFNFYRGWECYFYIIIEKIRFVNSIRSNYSI